MSGDFVVIHPNVHLGPDCTVDPFTLLGRPPKGANPGDLPLRIGARATIRSHSTIYAGTEIGEDFQTGHGVLIRERVTIGNNCSIGSGSVIEFLVKIGHEARLHSNVFIPELSILEDGCWVGPNVVVTNARYPAAVRTKETLQGVTLRSGSIIGANSTILPGVIIGVGSLVGAGAVITRDVPDGMVVAGNPAKIVGKVEDIRYPDTGETVYREAWRRCHDHENPARGS